MLNELHQVVTALQARGVTIGEQHPSLTPMGKNDALLVLGLDRSAAPVHLAIVQPEIAGTLLRVCHGSQGSSFPGFNIPTPLRVFSRTKQDKIKDRFNELRRQRRDAAWVSRLIRKLFIRSKPPSFTSAQSRQFERSTHELVGWLRTDFAKSGKELANFVRLLQSVAEACPQLNTFAEEIAGLLAGAGTQVNSEQGWILADWLFTDRKLPVYLECREEDIDQPRVADIRTSRLLNAHLLAIGAKPFDSISRSGAAAATARDAYTGEPCEIPATFPDPKVALLGNVRLFSNNTSEAACFFRYGLGGSETFKLSKAAAQRMAGALLQLASDDRLNKTCRPIPSNREGKQDLLFAYLEDEPDALDPYVDLFGSEAATYDAPDFAAATRPVLTALDGKLAVNPDQLIRLVAIAALDKANKQISLNRSFTVREVVAAAQAWQAGAANCPPVTLPFFDKEAKKPVPKSRTIPSPLDVTSVLNKVWRSSSDGGFSSGFNRIVSPSDAFDIFLLSSPLRGSKTQFALQAILRRMADVFVSAAVLKITWNFKAMNEPARWCVLKAVALTGIFLHNLGFRHEQFMKGTIYQMGQLLAVADRLHFHYCKWVRTSAEKRLLKKVDAPADLVGNAVFNFALDNPVGALARLAERIRPYKGWATTYSGDEAGIARWLLGLLAECERGINLEELRSLGRLEDIHKAQLLLGYLADLPKAEEPPAENKKQ
jgi:hypothetical protein